MRAILYLSVFLFAFGCIEDSDPKTDPVGDSAVEDSGPDDASYADGRVDDAGPVADGEVMGDATSSVDGDVPPVDMMVMPVVNDCPSACQRISDCGRDDLFATTEACVAACDRVSEEAVPQNWFDCLQLEGCGLLQLCRLPEPRPMTCEEVCAEARGVWGRARLRLCRCVYRQ